MSLGDLFLLAPWWCVFVSPVRIDLLCYMDFLITHWRFLYVGFLVQFARLLRVTSLLPSDISSAKPGVSQAQRGTSGQPEQASQKGHQTQFDFFHSPPYATSDLKLAGDAAPADDVKLNFTTSWVEDFHNTRPITKALCELLKLGFVEMKRFWAVKRALSIPSLESGRTFPVQRYPVLTR
ncbi:hypothetical protein F5879DRAFT_993729 [Lentinula edodes]|nr:hypothetical protein F5879DRAFT_993729 [Lentinula edodes]